MAISIWLLYTNISNMQEHIKYLNYLKPLIKKIYIYTWAIPCLPDRSPCRSEKFSRSFHFWRFHSFSHDTFTVHRRCLIVSDPDHLRSQTQFQQLCYNSSKRSSVLQNDSNMFEESLTYKYYLLICDIIFVRLFVITSLENMETRFNNVMNFYSKMSGSFVDRLISTGTSDVREKGKCPSCQQLPRAIISWW